MSSRPGRSGPAAAVAGLAKHLPVDEVGTKTRGATSLRRMVEAIARATTMLSRRYN